MKKFATGILAFTLAAILPMVQVQAQETSLDSAIDNLQYRLTVEWDQKDMAAQKKIVSEFSAELEQLKQQGVTGDEIFKALSAKAFDAETAKDIAHLAKYSKENMLDQKQISKLVIDYSSKNQKLGTSWSTGGSVVLAVALVALIIVAVIALPNNGSDHGSYDCDCFYDSWGDYYCYTCYY